MIFCLKNKKVGKKLMGCWKGPRKLILRKKWSKKKLDLDFYIHFLSFYEFLRFF